VPVDRTADAETVEEPPAVEHRPPPDTPDQPAGLSRADSRAGAAAANDAAGEQEIGPEAADEARDQDTETVQAPDTETTPADAGQDPAAEDPLPEAGEKAAAEDREVIDTDDDVDQMDEAAPLPDEPRVVDDSDVVPDSDAIARKDRIPVEDAPANPGVAAKDQRRAAQVDEDPVVAAPRDTPARWLEPLTDHEYTEHTAQIESSIADAVKRGESTDVQHTLNPERTIWHPDRAEIHQQIVDDLYSAAAGVPNDGQAIVAGGLGGAGKSTTLEDQAGIDRSSYLTINPDDIKESLAKRGMVPSVEGLAPMERSALVHEESSEIARSLASRAYADRKNVIWDITMSSRLSAGRRVQQLREAGYQNVEGIFVHIPVGTSVERAQARHRQGLEDYRNGEGLGGRYVPPDVIRANAEATWGSVNRAAFEELKPQFDKWKLYDNSVDGRGPMLLESSDGSERNDDE
jgi:predicted ABC-type ATPase